MSPLAVRRIIGGGIPPVILSSSNIILTRFKVAFFPGQGHGGLHANAEKVSLPACSVRHVYSVDDGEQRKELGPNVEEGGRTLRDGNLRHSVTVAWAGHLLGTFRLRAQLLERNER